MELCLKFVLHFLQQVSLYCLARVPTCSTLIPEEFLDKMSVMNRLLHVDCQKRFPVSHSMYQVAGFGRGSTLLEDLEPLPADWEREIIFHCKSALYLEIL